MMMVMMLLINIFQGGSLWQKSLCSRGGSHQHNNTGFAEEQTDSKFYDGNGKVKALISRTLPITMTLGQFIFFRFVLCNFCEQNVHKYLL